VSSHARLLANEASLKFAQGTAGLPVIEQIIFSPEGLVTCATPPMISYYISYTLKFRRSFFLRLNQEEGYRFFQ
jgi:hypothetical protein